MIVAREAGPGDQEKSDKVGVRPSEVGGEV